MRGIAHPGIFLELKPLVIGLVTLVPENIAQMEYVALLIPSIG